jgi:uncharacterized protein (DUF3084 family)
MNNPFNQLQSVMKENKELKLSVETLQKEIENMKSYFSNELTQTQIKHEREKQNLQSKFELDLVRATQKRDNEIRLLKKEIEVLEKKIVKKKYKRKYNNHLIVDVDNELKQKIIALSETSYSEFIRTILEDYVNGIIDYTEINKK